MSAPRCYCPIPLPEHTRIALPDAVSHHALRVLRLKEGSPLVLFNGQGGQIAGELDAEGKRGFARLGAHDPREAESAGNITLVQGLASGDKMDWIIEKAVELGARRLVPIAARRSVLQLQGDRLQKRMTHWQRIIESASEQCGRNRLMQLDAPVKLADFLAAEATHTAVNAQDRTRLTLLCHPGASYSLTDALKAAGLIEKPGNVTLLVGPEGGWSDEELAAAQAHALTPVAFGSRVLRTETAGSALIAAISALCGWL